MLVAEQDDFKVYWMFHQQEYHVYYKGSLLCKEYRFGDVQAYVSLGVRYHGIIKKEEAYVECKISLD